MTYWDGNKKTLSEVVLSSQTRKLLSGPEIDPKKLNFTASKSESSRRLSLETDFFLDLLHTDLAYRFDVSPGKFHKYSLLG